MSFWVIAMVAAKIAVVAPKKVTTESAIGAYSKIGESRATMKTPAVTMVAAWISAETGVGPSIASGSQVCSRNCADFPMAPTKRRMQVTSRKSKEWPRKVSSASTIPGVAANTASKETVSNMRKMARMPSAKPKSPTRLTIKALIAAALAAGRLYQKPINR